MLHASITYIQRTTVRVDLQMTSNLNTRHCYFRNPIW